MAAQEQIMAKNGKNAREHFRRLVKCRYRSKQWTATRSDGSVCNLVAVKEL